MENTALDPRYVWRYWENNRDEAREYYIVIAVNEEDELEVVLHEVNGVPNIMVMHGRDILVSKGINNAAEMEWEVSKMIDRYVNKRNHTGNLMDMESKADVEDRLDQCLRDFLLTVVDDPQGILNDPRVIDDIKNRVLEYVSNSSNGKLRVLRPMYFENSNGARFFTNYPYEKLTYCGYRNGGWKFKSGR